MAVNSLVRFDVVAENLGSRTASTAVDETRGLLLIELDFVWITFSFGGLVNCSWSWLFLHFR